MKIRRLRNNWAHDSQTDDAELQRDVNAVKGAIRSLSTPAAVATQDEPEGSLLGSVLRDLLGGAVIAAAAYSASQTSAGVMGTRFRDAPNV